MESYTQRDGTRLPGGTARPSRTYVDGSRMKGTKVTVPPPAHAAEHEARIRAHEVRVAEELARLKAAGALRGASTRSPSPSS